MSADNVNEAVTLTAKQIANRKKKEKMRRKKREQKEARSMPGVAEFEAGLVNLSIQKAIDTSVIGLSFDPKHMQTIGRYIIAKRDIKAGEKLMDIRPYAGVIRDGMIDKICHYCFQNASSLLVCGNCNHARFCSKRCMNAMSQIHLLECKALETIVKQERKEDSGVERLLLRISNLMHKEKEYTDALSDKLNKAKTGKLSHNHTRIDTTFKPSPGLTYSDVENLICHEEKWSQEFKVQSMLVCSSVQNLLDANINPPIDILVRLLMQIRLNAIPIPDDFKNVLGIALFPLFSYINHSCAPNCVHSFDSHGNLVLYALRDIKQNEQITVTFIDLYASKKNRAEKLNVMSFIDDCSCVRCTSVECESKDNLIDSFHCPEKHDSEIPLIISGDKSGTCPSCKKTFSSEDLLNAEENGTLLLENAREIFAADDAQQAIDILESKLFEGKPAKFLHSKHAIIFNANLSLMSMSRHLSKHDSTIKYARRVLESMAFFDLTNYPEYADVLYDLGEGLLYRAALVGQEYEGKEKEDIIESIPVEELTEEQMDFRENLLKESLKVNKEAHEIRETCYGAKHILTKASQKRLNALDISEEGIDTKKKKKGRKKR